MQKNEPSPTSMRQMVLEIFHLKVRNLVQDGHRHFVGFQPHFQLNMTSQMQYCKTMKKMKVQYLMNLLFDLFEILQAVRSEQTNFAWLQTSLLWQLKRE